MDDTEKGDQDLAVDEQISDTSLVEANVEGQREDDLPAKVDGEDQNVGEARLEEKRLSEKERENENLNETSAEDQSLGDHKPEPVESPAKEARQSEEELPNAPTEPDNNTGGGAAITESDEGVSEMPENKVEVPDVSPVSQQETIAPRSLAKRSVAKVEDNSRGTPKNVLNESMMTEDDESGTPDEQAAFMEELENFYREKSLEFKPPKFYGQPLNCLKLWRAVTRLGGYDRVTGSKLWRQVGSLFIHRSMTCTTVSWTFRIFYEKALLEYERHKSQSGELQLADVALPEPSSVENEANGHQASGSGRARRDAAARAMQGWHVQRLFGYGEVGEPIIKDKNLNNLPKREKSLKSIGSVKNKRPMEVEHAVKAARTETAKQLMTTVVDVGPPADWVKINVRETKDCFEVYALVPGLLREEVRVQSDPAGRLVITGQPEQPENPWGITAFKKVVSLPARIDPFQTSAVVSLHGRLYVRVPFEQSNM
ncbi:hypothetical protein NMG60_11015941 [Bertholletia excelsa]